MKDFFKKKRRKRLKAALDSIGVSDYVISEDGKTWKMSDAWYRKKDKKMLGVFFG